MKKKSITLKFISLFFLIFSNCTIKENSLSPNGPFGYFNLLYNLSKIGTWLYKDNSVLYYSIDEKITDNSPDMDKYFLKPSKYESLQSLPTGLSINSDNGVISGTPTLKQYETEYKFRAIFIPLNASENLSTLKINIDNYNLANGINVPVSMSFHFPIEYTYSNYSIRPDLPKDYTFDKNTGIISSTPKTTIENLGTFTFKATRSDGVGVAGVANLRITNWINEAYIKAPNSEVNDSFGGQALAISDDSIVLGVKGENSSQTIITNGTLVQAGDGSGSNFGAAYVFKRNGTIWTNEAYLKAPNTDNSDNFGSSVSISGNTIVVGATGEASNQTTITNGTLSSSNNLASSAGAAYVFRRNVSTWTNEAYLKAPNAESNDQFGVSVSISGDTIVVGATGESSNQTTITNGTLVSSNNLAANSGAAYVFRRNGTSWTNEAYLKASNAETGDQFGGAISIDEDTIVIGATQEASNQTTITNGLAPIGINGATSSGAAYVYRRIGSTWTNEAYLKAPNSEASDNFGRSVSIYKDTIVVGAVGEDSNQTTITNGTIANTNNSGSDSGAVYVFRRIGTTWRNEAYLKAPNSEASDNFGKSVSISINTIAVGADLEDSTQTTITNGTLVQAGDGSGSNSGAVYVFKRNGTIWTNEAYLKAPNAEGSDYFGGTVSVSTDTIVVGAQWEDSNQTLITNGTTASTDNSSANAGAVYVYRRK